MFLHTKQTARCALLTKKDSTQIKNMLVAQLVSPHLFLCNSKILTQSKEQRAQQREKRGGNNFSIKTSPKK